MALPPPLVVLLRLDPLLITNKLVVPLKIVGAASSESTAAEEGWVWVSL